MTKLVDRQYEWSDLDAAEENWREPAAEMPVRFRLSQRFVPELRPKFLVGAAIAAVCVLLAAVALHFSHSGKTEPPQMAQTQVAMDASADKGDSVPTPQPVASTAVASSTPPAPDTNPPAPDTNSPLPDTASNELDHVTRELFRFKYWLEQHPNTALLSQLYAPGSPAFNHFSQDMQTMILQHTTGSQPQATILNVTVVSQSATMAKVQAQTRYDNQQTFDETLALTRNGAANWQITDWVVVDG